MRGPKDQIRCEWCEEQPAKYKISITNLEGVLLYHEAWCKKCIDPLEQVIMSKVEDLTKNEGNGDG